MRTIIATRCDMCTYVFVRMYKIRTMETIDPINIGSVPDAYSACTIYVSKHVPWKAPLKGAFHGTCFFTALLFYVRKMKKKQGCQI